MSRDLYHLPRWEIPERLDLSFRPEELTFRLIEASHGSGHGVPVSVREWATGADSG